MPREKDRKKNNIIFSLSQAPTPRLRVAAGSQQYGRPCPPWSSRMDLGSPHGVLALLRNREWSSITLEVHPHGKNESSGVWDHESKSLPKKKGRSPSWPLTSPIETLSPCSQGGSIRGCAAPWGRGSSSGDNRVLYQMQEEGRNRHSLGHCRGWLWPKARFAPAFLLRCKWHASRLLSVASLWR